MSNHALQSAMHILRRCSRMLRNRRSELAFGIEQVGVLSLNKTDSETSRDVGANLMPAPSLKRAATPRVVVEWNLGQT